MMKNAGHECKKTYEKRSIPGSKELKMHKTPTRVNTQRSTNT